MADYGGIIMDTENIFTTDANRKEVKEIRENVSKLELISNQILADLEKDFTFSEQQHTVEMKNMQTELNRVRQKFDNDRNETAIRSNNEIAAVRRDMNSNFEKKKKLLKMSYPICGVLFWMQLESKGEIRWDIWRRCRICEK
jgi:hypothetical protein